MRICCALLGGFVACAAPNGHEAPSPLPADWALADESRREDLDRQLERALGDSGVSGLAMAVAWSRERQLWAGAAGLAQRESSDPWSADRLFRVGSVTKTFTAALIFQLEEEGVLSLDDPLEQWVSGGYGGVGVTLRHLVSHTSGIVSYNYIGSFNAARPWTPDELVAWAVQHEPSLRFAPGTQWEYSNTNYVLLGLVIEAATGIAFDQALEQRLLAPLQLTDTYLAGSGDDNPRIVDSYDASGANVSDTFDPSFGWAAGALVSSPTDLARWGAALSGGEILHEQTVARMTEQQVLPDGTTVDFGLGVFVETDGSDMLYGHTGGIGGYQTYAFGSAADDVFLVLMVNQEGADLRDLAAYGWSVPLGFSYP